MNRLRPDLYRVCIWVFRHRIYSSGTDRCRRQRSLFFLGSRACHLASIRYRFERLIVNGSRHLEGLILDEKFWLSSRLGLHFDVHCRHEWCLQAWWKNQVGCCFPSCVCLRASLSPGGDSLFVDCIPARSPFEHEWKNGDVACIKKNMDWGKASFDGYAAASRFRKVWRECEREKIPFGI